jgi:hydrogenase expression/formation protein HypC
MCLAVPMLVTSLDGATAVVAQDGVERTVRVDFLPDLRPGDYVLIHAGVALQTITPADAEATLRLLKELADAPP